MSSTDSLIILTLLMSCLTWSCSFSISVFSLALNDLGRTRLYDKITLASLATYTCEDLLGFNVTVALTAYIG